MCAARLTQANSVKPYDVGDDACYRAACQYLGYSPKGRVLSADEVAHLLGTTRQALEQQRHAGKGPEHIRPDDWGRVTYSERVVVLWLYRGRRSSTSTVVAETA